MYILLLFYIIFRNIHHRQLTEDLFTPTNLCQRFLSMQGNPKISYRNQSYLLHIKLFGDIFVWRCDKNEQHNCNAKIWTANKNGDHYVIDIQDLHICESNTTISALMINDNDSIVELE